LVNLVLDRDVVPEMIQERCRPDLLVAELSKLLDSEDARDRQRIAFAEVVQALTPPGAGPSERAAAVVLKIAKRAPDA
jgi:lipid-A-disaccharide synthase